MGIYVRSLVEDTSVISIVSSSKDEYSFSTSQYQSTNAIPSPLSTGPLSEPSRVECGVNYAMSHYESLIRKLSD